MAFPLIAGLLLLAAAAQAPTPAPVKPPLQVNPDYVIGPNDVIGVRVFGEDKLSSDYNVDLDGSINFPLLGRVVVGGKTLKAVETDLTQKLADGYINNPQVAVGISQYRSRYIFVLGEVRTPAKYSIEGQMTLLEVIAKAGSVTPTAGDEIRVLRFKDPAAAGSGAAALPEDARTAVIMRVSLQDLKDGKFISNILLQDGDTIFVPAADRFFVGGFVRNPGSYVLQPGMTVRQALIMAGGLTDRGSDRGITITRLEKGKERKLNNIRMDTKVLPGDTINFRQRRL